MSLDPDVFEQLLDTVRRFVREQLIPAERQTMQDDQIPAHVVQSMRELGLFGLTLPEEFGGLALSAEEEAHVVFELCFAAPVFRSYIGTSNGLCSRAILNLGNSAQKERYLRSMAAGNCLPAFALTEPEAGSDAASIRTLAIRTNDGGWKLEGTKRYITNSSDADLFVVFARSEASSKGSAGISAFLIERGNPGLSVGKPYEKMGQHGAKISDVILESCVVQGDSLLGQEGLGFQSAMRLIDRGRLHIAAVCVGLANRIIYEALKYACERKQFGQPIAEFQLVQAMLADSQAEALAARAMVLEAARKSDRGESISMDASCCKMFASEAVGRIADRGVQIHGGAGYMAESNVEWLYRDARLFRIYEGTTQIQQIVIAKHMIRKAGH